VSLIVLRVGQARLHRVLRVGAGLLDQAVVATANAGTTLLGPLLLDRDSGGLMVLALGVGYFAAYLNRALVGDVLMALGSRYEGPSRDALVCDGLATAFLAGIAGSVAFVVIWWVAPGFLGVRDLIWIAPFMPAILLQDTARCGHLAAGRHDRALRYSLLWVACQAVLVTGMVLTNRVSAGGLLVAWGLGAVVACTTQLAHTRLWPWHGSPRRWLMLSRHLSGWLTATALIGQLHLQTVNFLVAVWLSPVEVSGLRFVQTILMQPVQNLISAAQALQVPEMSRAAHQGAMAFVRRRATRLALGFGGFAVLFVLVVWPLADLGLSRTGKFADVAPLALPVSVQAGLYLVQTSFASALRAMHRPRMLFLQYTVFSAAGLTSLGVGAAVGQLTGAVWGLVFGTFTGLVTMYGCFVRALATPPPGPAAQSTRSPAVGDDP
jgi:O-antigen/teichoic acid export membrane protein